MLQYLSCKKAIIIIIIIIIFLLAYLNYVDISVPSKI